MNRDTPILMYDGSVKMVQDVQLGDQVMGDDSTPRNVLSLGRGHDQMYDIVPVKGQQYTVNSDHMLVLKYNSIGITYTKTRPEMPYRADFFNNVAIAKITKRFATRDRAEQFLKAYADDSKRLVRVEVKDVLKLAASMQKELKGVRTGVEYEEKALDIDPYLMGVWLGDGCSAKSAIVTADPEILEYLHTETARMGAKVTADKSDRYLYHLVGDGPRGPGRNPFMNALVKYDVLKNKHIPEAFLINSRQNRLALLAGLLDTDGYWNPRGIFEITQKSDALAQGILYLARSLGFAAYNTRCEKSCMYKGEKKTGIYNRICISGSMEDVPTILPRKRATPRQHKKDVLVTGVKVQSACFDNYYEFTLDGNHRFLLGDFTITISKRAY